MEENREEGLTQKSKLHVETSDEETSQQISEEKSKSWENGTLHLRALKISTIFLTFNVCI